MKFRVSRKEFLDCLSVGSGFAGRGKVLPILDCCKVRVGLSSCVISSTDGECAVTRGSSLLSSDGEFEFCVNASDFMKALKTLRDVEFDIEVSGGIVRVLHGCGIMEFPSWDADEYPSAVTGSDAFSFAVSGPLLAAWLSSARNFVLADANIKPQLAGVYLYHRGGSVGVCATDGSRMFHDWSGVDEGGEEFGAVICSKAFNQVIGLVGCYDSVGITIDSLNICFTVDNARLLSRLPAQRYPNFRSILPNGHSIEVSLCRSELSDIIDRAMLFADPKNMLCRIDVCGNTLEVTAQSFDMSQKSSDTAFVEHTGDDIRIGVKGGFLRTCLDSIDSDRVVLEFNNPRSPLVLKDYDNPNRIVQTMPFVID